MRSHRAKHWFQIKSHRTTSQCDHNFLRRHGADLERIRQTLSLCCGSAKVHQIGVGSEIGGAQLDLNIGQKLWDVDNLGAIPVVHFPTHLVLDCGKQLLQVGSFGENIYPCKHLACHSSLWNTETSVEYCSLIQSSSWSKITHFVVLSCFTTRLVWSNQQTMDCNGMMEHRYSNHACWMLLWLSSESYAP